jgi:hypothetical protein
MSTLGKDLPKEPLAPVKKFDVQMETKSAWEETKHQTSSMKHASSVPYDILSIVKKP